MSVPAPSQPKAASRAAEAAGVVAAAFVPYLPYTKVLSSESNRRLMFYTHADALALLALVVSTIAVFAGAWLALKRLPDRFGAAARRCAVSGAIGLSLLNLSALFRPIGSDAGYATNYIVLALLTVAIAGWDRTHRVFARVASFAARFVAPAPAVFLLFLFVAPEHPPFTTPSSARHDETESSQGPVYIFLFDCMDAGIAIQEPKGREHAPNLHAFLHEATYFERSESPGTTTANSVPSFLFQNKGSYDVEDGVYYLIRDGTRTPTSEMTSLYEQLDTGKSFKVLGGWYLDYRTLFGERLDWLHTTSYEKPLMRSFDELVWFAVAQSTHYGFVPLLRGISGIGDLSFVPHVQNTRQIHQHALEVIADRGNDVIAFFHYPVPHSPYVFERNGPRPPGQPAITNEQAAYRMNLEYADTLLGELLLAVKKAGRWSDATIVVMSDHGLRNTNCVFVVKMPGQTSPVTVVEPVSTAEFLGWLKDRGHPRVR
ncbi:MAG: sulfatase-like hydrolase/transferase [Planctomycetes bacterium]|nr:sulfatase-like hydrolase/transferase [Planctomycetota bacterium]MCW8134865.1 sulfatase-like hydrolase/transferase [Planctomycetota bacterium]